MRLILAALAVACCVLYYVAKFVRSYYKAYQHLKVVPGPPRDNLILGHVKDLFLDPAGKPLSNGIVALEKVLYVQLKVHPAPKKI